MTNEDRENIILLMRDQPVWTVLYSVNARNGGDFGFECGLNYEQALQYFNELKAKGKFLDFASILIEVDGVE
jgi:hypothetical protein